MPSTMIKWSVVLLVLRYLRPVSSESQPDEQRLMEDLFQNYTGLVRPSKSPSEPLNVSVGMAIEALADVDDREGTVTISGWVDIYWKDEYMCWEPSDYGNISFFIAPAEKFWRPDLAFNSAIGERFFTTKDQLMSVTSDCTVNFAPGGRSTHSCDLDMTLFPFDTQHCKFVVLTWFSGVASMRLESLNLTFDGATGNEVWRIIGSESSVSTDGTVWGYQTITFTLHMKRKPLYYILYVVFPLLMLALLNLMVFRLPPEADEKMSLAITVLLAFSIWLLMLNDLTPRSSDSIPILGIFIIAIMFLSAMSAIVTVHVLRIHHYDKTRVIPQWAIRLVGMCSMKWSCKCKRKGNQVKNVIPINDNDEEMMTWPKVAEAVDSLAFNTMLMLTVLMVVTCSFSVLIMKFQ